jgi:hypothetical protein
LGSAILGKADILPNGVFTITYGAWGDTLTNPITFTITTVSPDQMSLAGYSNGVCFGCLFAATAPDPDMEISAGGDAPPFPQVGDTISIPPDTQTFTNTNTFDIQTLDFTTPFLQRYDTEIFTCGGNEFIGCGFKLSPDGQTLDIRFTGPMVPEPGSWVLLLTVAAGITLKRAAPFWKRS